MTFAALDERFHSDPKVHAAGNDGAGVYARALSYCADYSTDGFIPQAWASEIAKPALRKKISASRLWLEVAAGQTFAYALDPGTPFGLRHTEGSSEPITYTVEIPDRGYFIVDYLEYNPTRSAVAARREDLSRKRSEAGKKGAFARWQGHGKTDDSHDFANGKTMANAWQADGPPPLPQTPRALALSPALSDALQAGHESNDPKEQHPALLALLHLAVGPTDENLRKLERAAKGCTEADLVAAREAAAGPGVNDKLAVALSTLKQRRTDRTREPELR